MSNIEEGINYFLYGILGITAIYTIYRLIHMWWIGILLFAFAGIMLWGKIVHSKIENKIITNDGGNI